MVSVTRLDIASAGIGGAGMLVAMYGCSDNWCAVYTGIGIGFALLVAGWIARAI